MRGPTHPTPEKGAKRRPPRKRDWRPKFLKALEATGNVSRAAKLAGVHRDTAYASRKGEDEAALMFAAAWDSAIEVACDGMELEARRRAVTGTDKPVFYRGKKCGVIREYSDTLLIFLLKAHRPGKYRERVSFDDCPNLSDETIKLLTDQELEQTAAGKISGPQLSTIIALRQMQQRNPTAASSAAPTEVNP